MNISISIIIWIMNDENQQHLNEECNKNKDINSKDNNNKH